MGLLSAAKSKAASTPKKAAAKGTMFLTPPDQSKVNDAIKELLVLQVKKDEIEGKMSIYKPLVKRFADDNYVKAFVTQGAQPESPVEVRNTDGEKITYVVQDRSGSTKVNDDVLAALVEFLGEDAAQNLVYEETTFSFDREILARDGAIEIVEAGLEKIKEALVKKRVMLEDESFVGAETARAYKPQLLTRTLDIVGKDVGRVGQFFQIIGSAVTRYLKL